jgi:Protein of unknown function (DUF3618)
VDEEARTSSSQVGEQEKRSPEEIRRDIEDTREDLGDTAEALAQKADVKGQAKAKADSAKESAQQKKESAQQKKDELLGKAKRATPDSVGSGAQSVATTAQENPLPFAVGAAFLGGVAVGWILRR